MEEDLTTCFSGLLEEANYRPLANIAPPTDKNDISSILN